MTTRVSIGSELRTLYADEFARIKRDFSIASDGQASVVARTALVESIVHRLWQEVISADVDGPADFSLVALGGFGRGWLFPYSDIDLLFLHAGRDTEEKFKERIRRFSQELWDLRLKLSPATRKLSECERFDPENLEFTISLLDCRCLAGDQKLFARLHDRLIPKLISRDCQVITQRLAELTRERHAKFGMTVFHLEPNVKDGPGGLRDYNAAHWLARVAVTDKLGDSESEGGAPLPFGVRKQLEAAFDFQTSVRCFLHFRHARDDNSLAWEAQDDAAAQKIGVRIAERMNPSDWMRIYFSHARSIHRACTRLLEENHSDRPSFYRQFKNLRSRLSNGEFSVVDDMIFLRRPEKVSDPEMLLRAFRFMARHRLKFSSTTEDQIERNFAVLSAESLQGVPLWVHLQEILLAPHASNALREMHSLRLLAMFLPELAGIDALALRDYSHRYTVDEHTFVAIENLHRLRQSQARWDQRYAELLDEVEQPELLYLALLLHDSGKGAATDNHVQASVALAAKSLERLDVDPPDRETVLFLIDRHLDMSAALRRDIFDPETVQSFAEKIGTSERLKMLCLLTYADIKAVNPEALTPWKAENLWQLYIGAANRLIRSVDQRFHAGADEETLHHLQMLAPAAGRHLQDFLEGLPRRYLRTHSVDEVLEHLAMAARVENDPVQLALRRGRHWYELTLVTTDRPFLFAAMAGVLAAWGMNIVKAAAFSNQAGTVVDTFYFTDRFRTLELNLSEWDRFKDSIHSVLLGKADLARMLQDRLRSEKHRAPKVKVETQIEFDDTCSAHSTLVEVIAQDQPGLLYRISSQFSGQNCNIEIALIETEGQTAIDVFYLTSAGSKLTEDQQHHLRKSLLSDLSAK